MSVKGLIISIMTLSILVGCGDGSEVANTEEKARVVQLADVKTATRENVFTFPAKVTAKTTVNLAFQVAGRLVSIDLPEGQYVKKGQVLARLDPKPFERAVRMATVRQMMAETEFKRLTAIATKGIGSEKSVDNAQANFELTNIALENAKADLSYSVLRAPFNALVSKRLIENKGFIKVGQSIAHLQDLSSIHFKFDVPERMVSDYSRDQVSTASAYIDGAVDQSFKIHYVENSTEPNPISQTYEVIYAMKAPKGVEITPGVRATVTITGDSENMPQVLGVPLNAVMTGHDDSMYVWVVNKDTMRISKQKIVVGPMVSGWIAVLSGLEAGQQVVAAGVSQMTEGLLVRPFVKQ